MATKKVNIDIIAKDKSKAALRGVRSSLDGVKKSIFNVRNAFIGLGAGLAIRSLVKTGMEIEGLQVRLKFLFGSAEEGAKAFDKMAKFAAKVPFSLEQIQQGSGVLAVVSKDADELAHIMEITGNVAAVTGLDFKTTAEQIQRSLSAGISAADLFRDRGVKSMLGFKAGAVVSVEETAEAFERVFGANGQFGGATDELAKTFEGTLSMIGDKFFNFKRAILEAGFFPELKKQFGDLDTFLKANQTTLDEIAVSIGQGLAQAVKISGNAIIFLKDNFGFLVTTLKLLISYKIAGVFIGLAGGIMKANGAMLLFNATIKRNLFIAGAAIVISQFDKILEMLGKMPKDFDNASLAIAHNSEQIKHYNNQLGQQQGVLNLLIKNKKQFVGTEEDYAKALKESNDAISETEEKIKAYKKTNDDLFKNSYPVYEDAILRLVGGIQKENEALKINKDLKKDISLDPIIEVLKKEVEAERKKEEEINKILEENRQEGINIFYDMLQTKERIAAEFHNREIKAEKEKILKLKKLEEERYSNNLSELKNRNFKFEELAEMSEENKINLTKASGRELLGELAKSNQAAFAINKAFAIKDAIVSTAQGITKALGMGPFGIPLAVMIGGLGAVQIATIAKQEYTGRQLGGKVNKGQPYMVGESGREMFVPNQSGNIVPNHDLKQGVNVNFNINTVDASGFNQLLVNSRGVIVNMINSAVNEKGRAAII